MSQTFTGQIRVAGFKIDNFKAWVEQLCSEHGFSEALSHVNETYYKIENGDRSVNYYEIYLDGSATVSTQIGDLLNALAAHGEAWGAMYACCNNPYGNYSFEFNDTIADALKNHLAVSFLNDVIKNAVMSLQDSTIEDKKGLYLHSPYKVIDGVIASGKF